MPFLLVHEPGQLSVAIPIHDGFVLGRHDDNDLPLAYQPISRRHARLRETPEGWELRDLGSTNGTFLNGVRVESARLREGDRLRVGPVALTFVEREPGEIVHTQDFPLVETLELDRADRRLGLLLEVTRAVSALEDPDDLLGRLVEATRRAFGCERAMAALGEGGERAPLRRIIRTKRGEADGGDDGDVVVSRSFLVALLVRRQAVIVEDTREGKAPQTMAREGILSAMGAPLEVGGRVLGFLYVDDRAQAGRFCPADLDFLSALSRLTAAALAGAERCRSLAAAAGEARTAGPLHGLLGHSPAMLRLQEQIRKVARAPWGNVLVRGESGTGKELVARALHAASPRAERPFVAVNCAALPDTMIEGELFGYTKGAFTGAQRDRRGAFALAHRGTLFLDEIGDLSLAAQAKVLRALQEGEIRPLGAEQPVRVDVRVIAATHKDLPREIEAQRFREDLYFRLNVVELLVPPLRERRDDVAVLAHAFLETAALNLGKRLDGFGAEALRALSAHRWPGNVRQLKNEVDRAAILVDGPRVELSDLSPGVLSSGAAPEGSLAARFAALGPTERALVEEALAAARGNLSEAARILGITRIMMRRRVERFGLGCRDE